LVGGSNPPRRISPAFNRKLVEEFAEHRHEEQAQKARDAVSRNRNGGLTARR
jgi:hypothetical protein